MKRVLPFAALHHQENHRGVKLPSNSSSFLSVLIYAISIVAMTSSNAGGFIFSKLYPNDRVESTVIYEYDTLTFGKDALTYTTKGSPAPPQSQPDGRLKRTGFNNQFPFNNR